MKRSPSSTLAALAVAALVAPACAFADGDPWGRLELDLAARVDASADRVEDGAIKTARDYLVRLDAVEVEVEHVVVRQRAAGAAAAFDPADPPEGYSLCHNGHCHSADGRLVSYEDIAAEVAGAGAGSGPSVTLEALEGAVTLPVAPATLGASSQVPLDECPGGCTFARGDLDTLEVALIEVRVTGVVHDRLTGDSARLPAAGRRFDVVLPASVVTASLDGAFDKGEPVGLRLSVTVEVPASLFDGPDWATAEDADLAALLAESFDEHASLTLERSSFD
ncbi:MAG: hypothetical protein EP329_07380 [Deltaproteobacteria bacterium]|nr:MAG: hypothetical protein EP329_07380 [Deltaproteobacteria bacterium]